MAAVEAAGLRYDLDERTMEWSAEAELPGVRDDMLVQLNQWRDEFSSAYSPANGEVLEYVWSETVHALDEMFGEAFRVVELPVQSSDPRDGAGLVY